MILLDTCAAIWISEDDTLSDAAIEAMDAAHVAASPVYISPITAWERGLLSSLGRLASPLQPLVWFERMVREGRLAVAPLTPSILIDSSFLPQPLHRDPADRILIATARALDLTLITRDRHILDYADKGHVRAIAC